MSYITSPCINGNSPVQPSPGAASDMTIASPIMSSNASTPVQTPSGQHQATTPGNFTTTAHTSAASAGAGSGHGIKAPRILACVLCQHRKIKCDRNTPCSNCIKANATCTPSTPAPARKRRRPNQDLQERLARCEELLKTYYATSGSASSISTSSSTPLDCSTDTEPAPYPPKSTGFTQTGRVVMEDGTTRFTDNVLWSKFYDELSAMRQIINTQDSGIEDTSLGSESASPDELTELMMKDYSNMSLHDVQPEPVQMFRLWQVFLDRVNPLMKIIHVPTIQGYIVNAAGYSSTSLPANYRPLIFAIFTMAVYSLTDIECRQMLGVPREDAIKKYSHGVRTALSNVNFMQTYDIPILQGLFLYSISLSGKIDPHSHWIFGGICMRLCQKMGLHRDGEVLGLSPFETEMRRRIWWQIVLHDAGCALMTGMSVNVIPSFWDTKLPSNVNDADLFPGSTDPVEPREGPTEMGFSLISYELGRFMIRSHGMAGFETAIMGVDPESGRVLNKLDLELVHKYRAWVRDFKQKIQSQAEKYLDPTTGPMHEAASLLVDFIMKKLLEVLEPSEDMPQPDSDEFDFKDRMFRLGVLNLESHLELYQVMEGLNFLWFAKCHFSTDVMVMVAGRLMKCTTGPFIDRAWIAIDRTYYYHPELFDINKRSTHSLGTFLLKGWAGREAALVALGEASVPPRCILELRTRLPNHSYDSFSDEVISEPPIPSSLEAPMSSMPMRAMRGGHSNMQSANINNAAVSTNNPADSSGNINPNLINETLDPSIDQIIGGYLNVAQFDWDMWQDGSSNNPMNMNTANIANVNNRTPQTPMMHNFDNVLQPNSLPATIPGFGNIPVVHGIFMNSHDMEANPDGLKHPAPGPW
ncbi:hypothetical protein Cpir12675_006829 [Ceratocystis pirilliformis]|uniref:Zn(2)-C6 fungal-type domain-containing protein n=1 Tax=Ceratocystis pirilliformis TaxID=259994 RepID=A0ABR3YFX3_9PEZI